MAEPQLRLEEFAPAKVNLALHVLGRREDGYHELDSIVAFAAIGDRLSLQVSERTVIEISGPFAKQLDTGPENLVCKAHELLTLAAKEAGQSLPAVSFHLQKNLPVASGIGGGSADAAAALRGLMRLSGLSLPQDRLLEVALKLGADVPVCLNGKTCRMRGVGEELSHHEGQLPPAIVLVNPLVSAFTPAVFSKLGLARGQSYGGAIDPTHPQLWRNDLANPARSLVPEIDRVLNVLVHQPSLSTIRMSGSGATCFGLAHDFAEAELVANTIAAEHPGWWVRAARIL